MDFWASLEHKIYYKFEGHAPDYLEEELKACADMVDMLDAKMFSLNEAITAFAKEQREDRNDAGEQGNADVLHGHRRQIRQQHGAVWTRIDSGKIQHLEPLKCFWRSHLINSFANLEFNLVFCTALFTSASRVPSLKSGYQTKSPPYDLLLNHKADFLIYF